MVRIALSLTVALVAASAIPVAAQDMPGAVDLGALARGQVQSGAARGYAERGGETMTRGPNGVPLSARSRGYCEDYPNLRSRHGARDPRVIRLASACRQAGYRY